MTDKERLICMTGEMLIKKADSLGIKVKCNRTRTQLKESKAAVADRILEAQRINEETDKIIAEQNEEIAEQKEAEKEAKELILAEEKTASAKPKRGQLIEYNGKSQNICAWAKELGISANTLYGRLYRLNWPIEKAFAGGKKNE